MGSFGQTSLKQKISCKCTFNTIAKCDDTASYPILKFEYFPKF
jgi:hypothetical protein